MTTRTPARALATGLALAVLAASAAPALAATRSLADPTGDQAGNGLDVTRATLHNRDRSVVVRVRFDEVRRGDLIVSVDPRRARGVRLVSEHRPRGTTRNYVIPYAFSDGRARVGAERRGVPTIDCEGFRVRWDDDADRARLVLPSTCLRDGDYGAVRFAVLTESGAGDVDYAPENESGHSRWIARG